ncbi:hypothetical protein B9T20_08015 [Wohlfahrtiimonas sp. G9077]|nr:hypothetical protein B9T20_08015 [Wohlfahrtiimonas sp. G9077]
MGHIKDLISDYRTKRDEIKSFLNEQYGNKIYDAFNSGSYKKYTAINTKFDLDVVVPFKYKSFTTLEEMFDDVYAKLNEKYEDECAIKKQGVSIGLSFEGDQVDIDIVPARETSIDSFSDKKDLNLHKSNGGYLKTNIHSQIDHIKAKQNERKVIRLLKIWKHQNNHKYKSFFIELLVIKAYEKEKPKGTLWEQLSSVLAYAIKNINTENFSLIDPGNTNNNLMNTLDDLQKASLVSLFKRLLYQVEQNEKNIMLYFEKNEEFAVEQEDEFNDKTYGLKKSAVVISTPPSSSRFG